MYRGFKINDVIFKDDSYYQAGQKLMEKLREQVSSQLEKYLAPNGSIDGEALEADWFPQVKVDIFISHSHADERLAFELSGWLYHVFGLKTFVDSAIWGYADALLRKIDNVYCVFPSSTQYDYNKRNKSTSFVHMMLAMAIAKLIDKTECLFLLNTPNAVKPTNAIDDTKTHSPWLYYEAGLSGLLRKPLSHHRSSSLIEKGVLYSERAINEEKNFEVTLPLATKHLTKLGEEDLNFWESNFPNTLESKIHPLDMLYELY